MIDIKKIRLDYKSVEKNISRRGKKIKLKTINLLDKQKINLLQKVEIKKNLKNIFSKKIGILKKNNKNFKNLLEKISKINIFIDKFEKKIKSLDCFIEKKLISLPNLLLDSVPNGKKNKEIKKNLQFKKFKFKPQDHYQLGTKLNILDFARGSKVSGSNFVFLKELGAKLERSLINFMIDEHLSRGYKEIWSPFLVTKKSLFGTGQLPKFKKDMFKIEKNDLYLIPTGEVPLTNFYSEEILKEEDLPIKICGFSPCFRSEAGATGKDTKGIIRMHQFSKVELINFVKPETSEISLKKITEDAEHILKKLELPYRIISLCSTEIGFSSCKTYDIEVYMPGYNDYKEISSCSLCSDFQTRRNRIKFKNKNGKNEFIHTLNASGLAVGRTMAAILENYQEKDGSINIPKVLIPYMGINKITSF